MSNKINKLIPVILGSGINALGLVRSYAKKNIKSIVVDSSKSYAFYSKYCSGVIVSSAILNADAFVIDLLEFGKTLNQKGFLIPTNDEWLFPISRNQKELEKYFVFSMSENKVIEECSDKTKLYEFAGKFDIPHPKTFFLDTTDHINDIKKEIPYPCILKPTITVGYVEKLKTKGRVFRLENENELNEIINKIKKAGLNTIPHVLQEYILGGVENLYTITTYSNKSSDIIAYSTGHKIRQNPPDAGTIISGRVTPEPILLDLAQRLIKNIKFYGIANTEFKKDDRDGSFKLIEINPRPGKWNYSVTASGINMPYIALKEAEGIPQPFVSPSKQNLIWIVLIEDFLFSVFLFKKRGFKDFAVSFKQWRKSIKGKKVYPIFSLKDLGPFLFYLKDLTKSI